MPPATHRLKILLAFACLWVVWGTTYLAIAVALRGLPPFSSCAARFLLASLLLYAVLRVQGPRPLAGLPVPTVIVTGVLLCGLGNGFTVFAQQGLPTGIAALLNASIPICVTLLDWAFFARRRPGALLGTGLAVGIAGVALIVADSGSFRGVAGAGWFLSALVAVVAWSAGTLLQRGRVRPDQLIALACGQMMAGAAFHLVAAVLNGEGPRLDLGFVTPGTWAAVLYLALFGSVITQSAYLWLLSQLPAGQVATYALINPVVAMLLGVAFLGEAVGPGELLGAALVLGGVALVLFQGPLVRWLRSPVPK